MCRQVGLDGASSHSGRRTFAKKLIDDVIALIYIHKYLRHKIIQTTKGYIQENPMLLGKISTGMNT
jgi:integrase/recombinase XerD